MKEQEAPQQQNTSFVVVHIFSCLLTGEARFKQCIVPFKSAKLIVFVLMLDFIYMYLPVMEALQLSEIPDMSDSKLQPGGRQRFF